MCTALDYVGWWECSMLILILITLKLTCLKPCILRPLKPLVSYLNEIFILFELIIMIVVFQILLTYGGTSAVIDIWWYVGGVVNDGFKI